MSQPDAVDFVNDDMKEVFPLGVYKDEG